ncbi:DMT family transporter [Vibrio sinaloensis]|uniref:DMT family transporter n=1 Tax=Photobacterium sp. (strain ATCC 43367) TaxID=379097 RepID=UPI00057EE982|nr:DMT family transporter [Vibrio sinaloensis]KHT50406.1 multidrug transporter [Vibrio sinaloensis]
MNILLAMIPAFFWGTTYAVTQYTLSDWPPLLLGAIRALPAGLLLLAFKPSLPKAQDWGVLVRLGFINIATFFVLIFVMALTLPSAISGVGMISVPVFAMLYTWLRYKKRPGRLQAVSGAALIALAWMLFDPRSISLNPVGLAAMLGAISCIIVGSSLTKSLGERIHWWTVLSWQLILGGAILTLAALIHSMIQPAQYAAAIEQLSMTNVLGLLWVVLLNTALGYGLYVWLLQRMSVVDFTFGGIANPVAGIVSGLLLLGESFTPVQYSLMVGMIAMSLLPQVVDSLRSQAKAQTHAQIN